MSWFRRRADRVRYLFRTALAEDVTPHGFAMAVALGAFISSSPVPPVLGIRSFTTLGLAWVLRLSKLIAFLGSHLVVIPLWGFLVYSEMKLGCRLLARPVPPWGATVSEKIAVIRGALLACTLGAVVIAGSIAVVTYFVTRPIVSAYQRRRAARQ